MRLRCSILADRGSEVVASFRGVDGPEEVVIDRDSAADGIDIGYPIAQAEDAVLVELPRETVRGSRRAWVPSVELIATT